MGATSRGTPTPSLAAPGAHSAWLGRGNELRAPHEGTRLLTRVLQKKQAPSHV